MQPTGWLLALPELWLGTLILGLLVAATLWPEKRHPLLGLLAIAGLLITIPLIIRQAQMPAQTLLGGMYQVSALTCFFKGIFLATAVAVCVMTRQMAESFERGQNEFYLLILSATLGMFLVASSADFLMMFVALELTTISFYVMSSYLKSDMRSLESGIKYLILGSAASGFFLYGIAFLYGATGSTQFSVIHEKLVQLQPYPLFVWLALFLILSGISFKVAAVPFQLWVPDVYEGAPTPVTAFLSVGSKATGFVVALKVLTGLFLGAISGWAPLLGLLAGATILYGNLCAIPQRNVKRLMGYSSIGHAGYILMGIAAGSVMGASSVTFYLLSYLVTNLTIFLVIAASSQALGSDETKAYAGLSRRSPFLAAAMFLGLLSLAGVPPLSGFFGKFILLLSALEAGFFWLAVIGAAAVVISLYYYLTIVKIMYVDEAADPSPIPVSLSIRLSLTACVIGMLVIGIWQAPFLRLSLWAAQSLF